MTATWQRWSAHVSQIALTKSKPQKHIELAYGLRLALWGPRIIATDRQAPRICPRMIPLCSRFDSVLFTPKMFRIASYGDYSRSPYLEQCLRPTLKRGDIVIIDNLPAHKGD